MADVRPLRVLRLPLTPEPKGWATLEIPVPMRPDEWALMLTILNVMKPALVQDAPTPPERGEGKRT